jgi:hypothetical protein
MQVAVGKISPPSGFDPRTVQPTYITYVFNSSLLNMKIVEVFLLNLTFNITSQLILKPKCHFSERWINEIKNNWKPITCFCAYSFVVELDDIEQVATRSSTYPQLEEQWLFPPVLLL